MSNYKAITGSSKIVHRNQGGGSKLQGIPSSTNLNTSAHVAFRNRNVVCACNRDIIFCMNQLGGVGAGGIPGRSYAFAPGADGTHKQFYCGHRFNYYLNNNKHLIYPKSIELNIDNDEDLISSDRDTLNIQRSTIAHTERATTTQTISIGKINVSPYKYIKGYKLNSTTTPGEFELGPSTGKTIILVNNSTYMWKRYSTEIYYIKVLETNPKNIIKILKRIKTKTEVDKLRENELYIVNSTRNITESKTYKLLYSTTPPFVFLYIQNLNSQNESNMFFDNPNIKLVTNKIYYLIFSDIDVHIVLKVTKSYPSSSSNGYNMDIISEKNFGEISTINYDGRKNILYYKKQQISNPTIKLYVEN